MEQTLFAFENKALRLFKNSRSGRAASFILEEPPLFYDPPYRTGQEDELAWQLTRHLNDAAAFQDRVIIQTPYANFAVDFLIELGKRRVGFMTGDISTENEQTESGFQDALLIDAGGLDVIYRFSSDDIGNRLHDCLQLVAAFNPGLFSYEGLLNLETLSSVEARSFKPSYSQSMFVIELPGEPLEDAIDDEVFLWPMQEGRTTEMYFRRMCRHHPAAWLHEYERALIHYRVSEDVLRRKWARSA